MCSALTTVWKFFGSHLSGNKCPGCYWDDFSDAVLQSSLPLCYQESWAGKNPHNPKIQIPPKSLGVLYVPGKKKNKKTTNYSLDSLTINPGKVVEIPVLKTISRNTRDKSMIRSSQHEFTAGKSCLINLYWFCKWVKTCGDTQKFSGHHSRCCSWHW